MPIDASIYSQFAPRVQSPMDVQNALTQGALAQGQLQQNQLAVAQGRQSMADQQAMRNYLSQPGTDLSTPEGKAGLMQASPIAGLAVLKNQADLEKSNAESDKFRGQGEEARSNSQKTALEAHRSLLPNVQNQGDMQDWITGLYADPRTRQIALTLGGNPSQAFAKIPTDPAAFQDYLLKNQMGIDKYIANQTTLHGQNLDSQTKLAVGEGNNKAMVQSANIHAGATLGAAKIGQNTQFAINGIDPKTGQPIPIVPAADGAPGAPAAPVSPLAGLVDAIGNNQIPVSTALQRVPGPMRSQVLSAVQQKYPGWNESDSNAVHQTVSAFAKGPPGNMVRSNNVVIGHLSVLSDLMKAMDNGNIQLINSAKNAFEKATGSPAPTNPQAARQLVMGEVANVVAAGGAGVTDRDKADSSMPLNASPRQIAGTINDVILPLMAGKVAGLEQQYKAGTGRADFRDKYLTPETRAALARIDSKGAPGGLPQGWKIEKVGQ